MGTKLRIFFLIKHKFCLWYTRLGEIDFRLFSCECNMVMLTFFIEQNCSHSLVSSFILHYISRESEICFSDCMFMFLTAHCSQLLPLLPVWVCIEVNFSSMPKCEAVEVAGRVETELKQNYIKFFLRPW